jgi:hypothetical protein
MNNLDIDRIVFYPEILEFQSSIFGTKFHIRILDDNGFPEKLFLYTGKYYSKLRIFPRFRKKLIQIYISKYGNFYNIFKQITNKIKNYIEENNKRPNYRIVGDILYQKNKYILPELIESTKFCNDKGKELHIDNLNQKNLIKASILFDSFWINNNGTVMFNYVINECIIFNNRVDYFEKDNYHNQVSQREKIIRFLNFLSKNNNYYIDIIYTIKSLI